MYGWFNIGNNVAGIAVNMLVFVFFLVVVIGVAFMVYAAKQLKKAEQASVSKDD